MCVIITAFVKGFELEKFVSNPCSRVSVAFVEVLLIGGGKTRNLLTLRKFGTIGMRCEPHRVALKRIPWVLNFLQRLYLKCMP